MDARPQWHDDALCQEHDNPDLWFPDRGDKETIRMATRICTECPVKKACLLDALATKEPWGIRGAWTSYQRNRWLGKRRKVRS